MILLSGQPLTFIIAKSQLREQHLFLFTFNNYKKMSNVEKVKLGILDACVYKNIYIKKIKLKIEHFLLKILPEH